MISSSSFAPFVEQRALGSSHVHGLQSEILFEDAFDVVVIGSGASGAVAAETFVRAGLRTLLLEEGARLKAGAENAAVDAAAVPALAGNDAQGWSERGWPWSTRNLGGGTVFYGAASFRYTDFDFDPSERIRVDGLSVKWPINAADLAPFYQEMESRLSIDYSGFTCAGPAPKSLSLPAEHLWEGARRLGLSPRPTPLAVDRGLCDCCSLCISAQCTRGAKRDVVNAMLGPLADAPNLLLLTGVKAVALTQETRNGVQAVQCMDAATGKVRSIRGQRFVLACNAVQTAALLLRSVTPFAPHGLGNEHDLVGRGLCMKLSEYSQGLVKADRQQIEAHPIGYRGPFSTVCVLDHYLDERCPTGVGGLIYEAKHDDWPPLQVDGLVLRVETILADHPSLGNRVRLSSRTDGWGLPQIMLDYTTDPRDLARLSYMVERSADWLKAAGARDIQHEASNFTMGSTHLHGTCRAGEDPQTSVVDRDGKLHSLDNVHVVDGSYMPYPGGLNPTLTIQANALRIARRIVDEARGQASVSRVPHRSAAGILFPKRALS
ncbi:GMC oxidoreductase [Rugamonas sp. CCM 8940]|uniref:GMC oxidoreductase n=1 Tax=Rugamonas sp. CCM 8940 TaxID=2765359 RepID=UPI0018F78DDC|nr:GMC family oxidoreductase [Rugamonas sp. CCM 8940]MBJ7311494.1 GMC family oxidoreductase [Rugamonas sp. CCM 8940]